MKKATLSLLSKYLNPASRVVVRADFNVPITKDGKVGDINRIQSTIPTLHELIKHNPKSLVLLSHLGRPNGQRNAKYSLKPVLEPLQSLLGRPVTFLDDCVGENVYNEVSKSNGGIFLCQNVRFHPEQEGSIKDANNKKVKSKPEAIQNFRNELSRLGDVYVNDAFGTAHRAHSSVVGIKHKYRVAGLLVQKELEFLGGFLQSPRKPVLVILGGSKVTDKIELILNMLNVADEIIIGGGMSNPFLRQLQGYKLGSTQIHMPADPNELQKIIQKAKEKGVQIHLPVDGVCAQEFSGTAPTIIADNKDIPDGWQIFDKGPKTVELFDKVVQRANSIFWNGPIGVFQLPNFKNGSQGLLKSVIARTKAGATSIIGGGDTASLVISRGASKDVTFISTGGGASLEYMQGIKLPGVEALSEASQLK